MSGGGNDDPQPLLSSQVTFTASHPFQTFTSCAIFSHLITNHAVCIPPKSSWHFPTSNQYHHLLLVLVISYSFSSARFPSPFLLNKVLQAAQKLIWVPTALRHTLPTSSVHLSSILPLSVTFFHLHILNSFFTAPNDNDASLQYSPEHPAHISGLSSFQKITPSH